MRQCDHCGEDVKTGFCIAGGEEYYCSQHCLYQHYTPEEYRELYDDGNTDTYFTEFDDMDYHYAALLYAEKYGIVDYGVFGNTMKYREMFPIEKAMYMVTVNLDSMDETRKKIETDNID